jgi:hypothetical protein
MPVITAIWEVKIQRITVQGQAGQKLVRPHLNALEITSALSCALVIPATQET